MMFFKKAFIHFEEMFWYTTLSGKVFHGSYENGTEKEAAVSVSNDLGSFFYSLASLSSWVSDNASRLRFSTEIGDNKKLQETLFNNIFCMF